jgi:integrase
LHGYTAYSFRHTVASIYAADASIAPKTVQTILLGHADISTIINVYAKTDLDTVINAGRLFAEMMSILVTSCSVS